LSPSRSARRSGSQRPPLLTSSAADWPIPPCVRYRLGVTPCMPKGCRKPNHKAAPKPQRAPPGHVNRHKPALPSPRREIVLLISPTPQACLDQVVHILVTSQPASQPAEYRLPQQSDQQVASVPAGAYLRQSLAAACGQCEYVVQLAIRVWRPPAPPRSPTGSAPARGRQPWPWRVARGSRSKTGLTAKGLVSRIAVGLALRRCGWLPRQGYARCRRLSPTLA
jgi:hypothetical protein